MLEPVPLPNSEAAIVLTRPATNYTYQKLRDWLKENGYLPCRVCLTAKDIQCFDTGTNGLHYRTCRDCYERIYGTD